MRLRSVMSRAIFEAPTTRPSLSRIGETVREMSMKPSVLRNADRLEVIDSLSPRDPREDLVFLVEPIGRDDQGDRPTNGLVGRVAEEPFGPGIPRADHAVEGFADDGVMGGFDDCCETRLRLFGRSALGHVAEDQHRPDGRSRIVPDRCGAVVDRPLFPVPGNENRVVRHPNHSPLPQGSDGGVLDWLPSSFVDDLEDLGQRSPDGLVLRPAGQGLGDAVHECHAGLHIGADHRVADARQRNSQPLRPLAQLVFRAFSCKENGSGAFSRGGTKSFLFVVMSRHYAAENFRCQLGAVHTRSGSFQRPLRGSWWYRRRREKTRIATARGCSAR